MRNIIERLFGKQGVSIAQPVEHPKEGKAMLSRKRNLKKKYPGKNKPGKNRRKREFDGRFYKLG